MAFVKARRNFCTSHTFPANLLAKKAGLCRPHRPGWGAGAGGVWERPDMEAAPASQPPVPAPWLAPSSSSELLGAAAPNLSGFG